MSIYIILNPASASGAGKRTAPKVEAALRARGMEFELHTTEAPGHGEILAREAAQRGVEAVLAVGGDGTIHEVANGLLSVKGDLPAMGVIPLGTGNDFYRMVGAPKGIESALDTLAGGYAHPFDVGRVRFGESERYFVNLLGIGIDVAVLERRESVRRFQAQQECRRATHSGHGHPIQQPPKGLFPRTHRRCHPSPRHGSTPPAGRNS
jgi:diacylglycerol kinase (ATP)